MTKENTIKTIFNRRCNKSLSKRRNLEADTETEKAGNRRSHINKASYKKSKDNTLEREEIIAGKAAVAI